MPSDLPQTTASRFPRLQDLPLFEEGDAQARAVEEKRSRGEISCAECSRLKIKCDKQIPCRSCQRRNCVALCPNGSLVTGDGTRSVLAATEHLHRHVGKLRHRVRQLESALFELLPSDSATKHPLLAGEDASATDPVEAPGAEDVSPLATESIADSFGVLSIADDAAQHFFGATGGFESMLHGDGSSRLDDLSSPGRTDLLSQHHSRPLFGLEGHVDSTTNLVRTSLPTWERACYLVNIYFDRIAWLVPVIDRAELMGEMLPTIYGLGGDPDVSEHSCPHAFALLFGVLALAVFLDNRPSLDGINCEQYLRVSRAALGLQSLYERPTMTTVQALMVTSICLRTLPETCGGLVDTSWGYVNLAGQVSQTMGLHCDGERWKLPPTVVERRRGLFWAVFVADI